MANFRGKSTKAVDLSVVSYDKSVWRDAETKDIKTYFVTAGIHPDSPLAQGPDQTILALNSKKDEKSRSGYNNSAGYSRDQMAKIAEVAGDNKAPLLDKDSNVVGTIYGVQADLLPAGDKSGMAINTKTLRPTPLSVGEVGGRDIQTRIIETQKANKAAKEAQKPAPEAGTEAEVDHEREPVAAAAAEAQSELGG